MCRFKGAALLLFFPRQLLWKKDCSNLSVLLRLPAGRVSSDTFGDFEVIDVGVFSAVTAHKLGHKGTQPFFFLIKNKKANEQMTTVTSPSSLVEVININKCLTLE